MKHFIAPLKFKVTIYDSNITSYLPIFQPLYQCTKKTSNAKRALELSLGKHYYRQYYSN